jgi:hypothetical protein
MTTIKGGRPKVDHHTRRINVPLRLPRWVVEWIDTQPGTRAAVIERAMLKVYKPAAPTKEILK